MQNHHEFRVNFQLLILKFCGRAGLKFLLSNQKDFIMIKVRKFFV